MRLVYHTRRGNPGLLLFFLGWGMDENPFLPLKIRGWDLALIYDYRDLNFPPIPSYAEIKILGWSAGVYAGLLALREGLAQQGVFVNGTGAFCHPTWGIHPRLWRATWQALKRAPQQTLSKFYQNMFRHSEDLRFFLTHRPQRSISEIIEELEALMGFDPCLEVRGEVRAFVGRDDAIFPPLAQKRYWEERGIPWLFLPGGHFPFYERRLEEFFQR